MVTLPVQASEVFVLRQHQVTELPTVSTDYEYIRISDMTLIMNILYNI
jgi:hypothetical protein